MTFPSQRLLFTETQNASRAWIQLLVGALFYAIVILAALLGTDTPFIGEFIYNYYALSLLEGRLDVPIQIVGLEGHYTADGLGYVYHGLGPVITRFLALPFVDLTQTDLTAATIWLFAVTGSAAFLRLAQDILGKHLDAQWDWVLWVLVWVTGPGMILVSNASFFHEPIALGFACLGIFLLLLWRSRNLHEQGAVWAILPLAIAAGLTVHARPHVALGMYLGLGAFIGLLLYRRRLEALPAVVVATGILGVAGLSYMWLNTLRFGSPVTVDGSTLPTADVVYGFLYWGVEKADMLRFQVAVQEGRFYALRIPSNIVSYGLALNVPMAAAAQDWLLPTLQVRLEHPMIPVLCLWPLWSLLVVIGLRRAALPSMVFWVMLVVTVPIALLILSYPTVTMRYRVELWPLFFVLGMNGAAAVLRQRPSRDRQRLCLLATAVGIVAAGLLVMSYSREINWAWGGLLRQPDACAKFVSRHPDLGSERVEELCVIDGSVAQI